MADNSQSEISAVQTKRPRLEQDEHISSSSTSCNVPILNTQYESANLGPSINNSLENCSSTIDDVRPIHEAGSSGDRAGSSLEEASPLCSSSRPRPSSEDLSELSSTVPILQGNMTTDNEPSSSSATVDVNQHIDNENDDEDSDEDLDLNLGDWSPQPAKGPFGWLQQQMIMGVNPRSILSRVLPGTNLPSEMEECQLWALLVEYFECLSEPKRRSKLDAFNTMDDVIRLLQTCTKVLVLTGAGVSVSCGIPDFRSRDGIYARLSQDFPDLPDPQSMFDIHYFRRDPRPFFKFAKEIYPGQFKPSVNHQFISVLEQKGKLLRNYTQNIDTLEQVAGITKVIQCHGSFASASCTRCKRKVNADAIRQDIFNQVVPVCPNCPQDGEDLAVMKPDIVFFGEGLPNTFYESLEDDKTQADLLIVIGSSLKVRPVATIPNMLSHDIPQILINREPLPHMTFDIELLGDSDIIVNELCRRLGVGWNQICHTDDKLEESLDMPLSAKMLFETMPTPPYSQGECEENSQDVNDVSQTEAGADSVFQEAEQTDMAAKDQSEKSSEQNVQETDVEKQIEEKVYVSTESSSEEIVTATNSSEELVTATNSSEELVTATNISCETENNLMNKASSSSSFEINNSSVEESPVKTTSGKKKSQRRYSRDSIATHLKPSTFLFLPPNRYIFHGAEVYPDSDSDDSCEQNSLNTSGSSKDQTKTAEEPTTSATSLQDATEDAPTSVPKINARVMPTLPDTASVSGAIMSEMAPLPDAIGDTSVGDVNVIDTDPAVNPSMTLSEVGQHDMTNHKEVLCPENPEGTISEANLQPAHHIEHNPTNHRTGLSNSKTTSTQEMSKVCDEIPFEPNQT